jgi:hypothetical protein
MWKASSEMQKLVVYAAIALTGALVPTGAAAAQDDAPTLRLRDRSPVAVTGVGFERGERVRVTLLRETNARKIVRASRAGAFVVTFASTTVTRCDVVRVIATGGRGSRAALKILPPPACIPLRAP